MVTMLYMIHFFDSNKKASDNSQSKLSFSDTTDAAAMSNLSNNRAFRENKRIKAVRKKWYHKRRQLKQTQQKQRLQQKNQQKQGKKLQKKNTQQRNNSVVIDACCHCINKVTTYLNKFYVKYNDFYLKYFYFDSKYKVLSILFGELCEMLFQTYGLFLFGGIDLMNPNEFGLSENYQIIESFAIIVGLNGILVGIAWIAYVIRHDIWYAFIFVFFLFVFFLLCDALLQSHLFYTFIRCHSTKRKVGNVVASSRCCGCCCLYLGTEHYFLVLFFSWTQFLK